MSEDRNTEKEWLDRVALGDQDAFREIFQQHYKALCYYAGTIVDDWQEAEDLIQEVFSRLWDKRPEFPNAAALRSWLYVSVRNACLNHLKLKERQQSRERDYAYLAGDTLPDLGAFDPRLAETEIIASLYREIDELPAQCRRIFRMSYLEGKKNEEIAGALSISYNTVRTQKLRALKLIRAGLLKRNLLPVFYAWLAFTGHIH